MILLTICITLAPILAAKHNRQSTTTTTTYDEIPHHDRCENITVPFCKDIQYNMTLMPNILNQDQQKDIGSILALYVPLVKVNCSPHLQFFLCTVYVPLCTIMENPVPPCRALCLSARICEDVMKQFGYAWPTELDCAAFPERNTERQMCVGENITVIEQGVTGTGGTLVSGGDSNSYGHFNYAGSVPKAFDFEPHGKDYGFVCPLQFKVPKILEYSLRVGEKTERDCGAPCNMMFFSEKDRKFFQIWIGTWAMLCSISCLFTVSTFLIDTDRFRYPERPIIFLSVCYLMVAMTYVIGFLAGDSISCRDSFPNQNGVQTVSTITQGTKYELCTILFMVLYFFSMASCIWWVVLTLTWFLAAGLKWGHEAIEANSQYFHLAAWAAPAIKTITILAMGKVEGDILSGVCNVGIWNVEALRGFVLVPLCGFLILGTIFLLAGFVSLFRIRTVMKHDGTKTDKLEKLMIRIGIFSVLYTVPALIVIGCLVYEERSMDAWMHTWVRDMCRKPQYAIPCPVPDSNGFNKHGGQDGARPMFVVFMIKYLMYMIVGLTSSVWIWSGKTMHSWRVFFNRLKGRHVEAYV